MTDSPRGTSPTIAAELLASTALLFGAALLVAVLAATLLFPLLQSPGGLALFLGLILVADLAILFLFLRFLLRRNVFGPLEDIGDHAQRIAGGDYEHRIPPTDRQELDRMVESVNTMAQRLIRDQRLLEENVQSLERTNRELVETSDELIRTARMASVGTLAAGIAHELGNPLGALQASLDVARGRAERGGDVGQVLEMAREEAGRIDAIIRSVLEFVRPGEAEAVRAPVEVGERVREAVRLLRRRGALDEVKVTLVEGEGDVPPVLAQAQLVEQILVNLIMNGVQATQAARGAGGEVEVEIRAEAGSLTPRHPRRDDDPPGADFSHRRRMERLRAGGHVVPTLVPGPDVVIEVRDRGEGIPPEVLDRIFDPFFTTRAPGEGTGMGLAITGRIVEELGGEIVAENRSGGGALVRLRLPGCPPESSRPVAGSTDASSLDPASDD